MKKYNGSKRRVFGVLLNKQSGPRSSVVERASLKGVSVGSIPTEGYVVTKIQRIFCSSLERSRGGLGGKMAGEALTHPSCPVGQAG